MLGLKLIHVDKRDHWPIHKEFISRIFTEIALRWCQYVNIGSSNALEPSGNKLLPDPMLTQILLPYDVLKPQWVTLVAIDLFGGT